jgi:integrase
LAAWDSLLGDLPFASISDDDVFNGLAQLAAEPARIYLGKDGDGAPIHRGKTGTRSSATVNRYHAALSAVFTWAIKKRRAPRGWENPCHKVERAPETSAVVRFLSNAELERLLEACRASSWSRLYLLVLMAITTGARRGELLALTLGDVDLERGLAHIKSSKNDQKGDTSPKQLTY